MVCAEASDQFMSEIFFYFILTVITTGLVIGAIHLGRNDMADRKKR